MSIEKPEKQQPLAKYPQSWLALMLCVAGWIALLVSLWGLIPMFGNAIKLTTFDKAGTGLVALFSGVPGIILAILLFAIKQSFDKLASQLGASGLKISLVVFIITVLVYLSNTW